MEAQTRRNKQAIVAFRKNVYRVSPDALQAIMELTRKRVDSDTATGFILRQEGYDISPEELAVPG